MRPSCSRNTSSSRLVCWLYGRRWQDEGRLQLVAGGSACTASVGVAQARERRSSLDQLAFTFTHTCRNTLVSNMRSIASRAAVRRGLERGAACPMRMRLCAGAARTQTTAAMRYQVGSLLEVLDLHR